MTLLKTQDADAFIAKRDDPRAVVLVCGADAGLVSERVEALVRASVDDPADGFAVTRLTGDELAADPAKLTDEAQAVPMFGGRRAIRVRAGARNFAASVESVLALKLHECRIVIEAGDLKRSSPLRAICERARNAAVILCYADTGRELDRLIDEELRAAGLTIARDARAALMPLLGGDRRASRSELRKLALYAHGRGEVTVDDVIAVVGDASGPAVDDLVDAAFAGKPREVETHFARATAAATAPGTMIAAASRHCAGLHKMRLAVESGESITEVTDRIFFRRKPSYETALKAWSAARLAQVLIDLGQAAFLVRQNAPLAAAHARAGLLRIALSARGSS
jgi:DNA polymerase-3 subunit delta